MKPKKYDGKDGGAVNHCGLLLSIQHRASNTGQTVHVHKNARQGVTSTSPCPQNGDILGVGPTTAEDTTCRMLAVGVEVAKHVKHQSLEQAAYLWANLVRGLRATANVPVLAGTDATRTAIVPILYTGSAPALFV